MSDFNWNDHPIVTAAPKSASGGFDWNDHPIVSQAAPAVAAHYNNVQDLAANNPNSLAYQGPPTALDRAMEPVKRVMSIPGGITRTAAMGSLETLLPGENKVTSQDYMDALAGNAPGVGDQFARKYPDINPTLKDALNAGGNIALDPLSWSAVRSAVNPAPATSGISAGDFTKGAAQKIGKVLAGVPEETTARYLQDPGAINSAPERSQIADKLLELKKASEDKVSQLHDDLSEAKRTLADNKNDLRSGLRDQQFESKQKLNEAQQNFNEKKQAFKEALKAHTLTDLTGEVNGAIGDLKDQVSKGSSEAYDILDKDKGAYSVRKAAPILRSIADEMNIKPWTDGSKALVPQGQPLFGEHASPSAPITAQTAAVQNELRSFADRLENTPEMVPAPELKKMLQQIDNSEKAMYGQPGFDGRVSRAYKMVRGVIDDGIKAGNPEYAAKMADVSRKTGLLNQALDYYGTPDKAISNLNRLATEKGQAIHVPILESLEKETGADLTGPIKKYLLNQKILKTPSLFDQAIDEIPESRTLAQAKAKMAEISDPAYARNAQAVHEPLLNKIKQYQADIDTAKDRQQLFSGVTPDSITAKTKALGGANNYGAEIKFGDIDKAHGTDFEKQIRARNDLDQFQKTDMHGSRKTLLGALTGGLIGHLVDHPLLGAEIGGGIGASADKFSGQAFKAGLDKSMAIAKKIEPYSPAIKSAAKSGPNVLPFASSGGAASSIRAAQNPTKGPEKWANDGASKLIDHSPDDKATIQKARGAANDNPKVKQLLIQASDLKPGTKAMGSVLAKLKYQIAEGED